MSGELFLGPREAGAVKWYNAEVRLGFIMPSYSGEDLFVVTTARR